MLKYCDDSLVSKYVGEKAFFTIRYRTQQKVGIAKIKGFQERKAKLHIQRARKMTK